MLLTSHQVDDSVINLIRGRQTHTKAEQPPTERDAGRTPEADPPRQTDAAERQRRQPTSAAGHRRPGRPTQATGDASHDRRQPTSLCKTKEITSITLI